MNTRIYFILISVWTLSVEAEKQSQPLADALRDCSEIQSDFGRLVCYDNLSKAQLQDKPEHTSQHQQNDDVNPYADDTQLPALIADLDEAGFRYSLGRMDLLGSEFDAMLVGLGHRINVADFSFSNQPDVYFNVFGQIRAQFDVEELSTRNNRGGALINTDFSVGGELVQHRPDWSWRLSYRHRSTHLGDEFLIENQDYLTKRINLSYETLKFLAFKSWGSWDIYGGGGFITRMEPSGLHQLQWQTGWQYQGDPSADFTPLMGMDFSAWPEADRAVNLTLRTGLRINKWFNRPIDVFLEYQEGHTPYGQFYTEDFNYFGLSFYNHW